MADRVQFSGTSYKEAQGSEKAAIELRSDRLWVYVEVVGGQIQVWSGQKCPHCEEWDSRVIRCRLHSGVMMIARQLELI